MQVMIYTKIGKTTGYLMMSYKGEVLEFSSTNLNFSHARLHFFFLIRELACIKSMI